MVRSAAWLSMSGWFLPLRFPDLLAEGPLLWAAHYRFGSFAYRRSHAVDRTAERITSPALDQPDAPAARRRARLADSRRPLAPRCAHR